MKKIAILTTKQNYVWSSMQEVIPALESCWKNACGSYQLINVDTEALREYLPFIFKSDVIVLIAYNETIARAINYIRGELKIEIPIILHLYGHATIGMWPQMRFGTLPLLTKGDRFIGTCDGDLKCMDLCFNPNQSYDVSYPFIPLKNENQIPIKEKSFAFIGRISDQKNIDLIIHAYALANQKIKNFPKFYIYGDEDFLGFPNIGIESSNCLQNLEKLIANYKLEDKILLMGKKSREEIYLNIGRDHIFISASTHSDENFGMAAMRTIALGGNVILSKWGGHKNFFKYCPNQTQLIDVYFKDGRPLLQIEDFSNQMILSLDKKIHHNYQLPNYFLPENISTQFRSILNEITFENESINFSENVIQLANQQKHFESIGKIQQAFINFQDPILNRFYKAYL